MAKILGLDLGTNSIGWAVVDKTNNQFIPLNRGVQIFSEGVKIEKGIEKSKAAERTGFRSARRIKFRRRSRKQKTLEVLIKHNMCPLTIDELTKWKKDKKAYPINREFIEWLKTYEDTGINPYYYRDKASREKLSSKELGRAFYHLAQRRGFASNKIDTGGEEKVEDLKAQWENVKNEVDETTTIDELKNNLELLFESYKDEEDKKIKNVIKSVERIFKDKNIELKTAIDSIEKIFNKRENLGKVKAGIEELNEKMELNECQTLGQYFYKLYKADRNAPENKIRTKYTDREAHYLKEFEKICRVQQLPQEIIIGLKKAIFYQRPLKSQKGLVGKCTLEKNKPRCPVSHPAFEEYRMYSFINNIELKEGEKSRKLTLDEKDSILKLFYRQKSHFDFKEIAQVIRKDYPRLKDIKGKPDTKTEPDPERKYFNFKGNTSVSGCPVTAQLMSVIGKTWEEKAQWKEKLYESWRDKTTKDSKTLSSGDVISLFWHALFYSNLAGNKKELIGKTPEEKLKEFAGGKTTLDIEQIKKFVKIRGLKKEYANLSINAINKILHYLKQDLIYSHAVFMANMAKVVDNEIWKEEKNREAIRLGIDVLLESYDFKNNTATIINAQLQKCRENNFYYSIESETGYKTEIETCLSEFFGEKSWNKFEDKNDIIEETHKGFIERFKRKQGEGEFLKVPKIDEMVKSFLRGENPDGMIYCSDERRLKNLYHPSMLERFQTVSLKEKGNVIIQNGKPLMGLGSPAINSIKNPMAMRTLHQLRKLLNTLIKDGIIDEKTKVNIELARELNDANKRSAIERYQNERKEQHNLYREKIKELYKIKTGKDISPTDEDIMKFGFWVEQDKDHAPPLIISEKDVEKYQYWEEQNHCCIYTDHTIGITDFIGANPKYDIEHTIPRSVSYDNSQVNKTLCDKEFNRKTKGNKMPSELPNHKAILQRLEPWKKKYEELEGQIELLVKRTKGATTKEQKDKIIRERHYLTLHRDYWKRKYERFTMEEIKAGFKNSQKVDTGIITKYAREFLSSYFKNKTGNSSVYAVNGQMTDAFRKAWGLHEKEVDENGKPLSDNYGFPVYKEKDRSNHVHHCIDAITIACMTKDKYDIMAHAWGLEDKGLLREARKEMENSKPWETFTEDVKKIENELLVVHVDKDTLPKQSVKKLKKRGRIVYGLKDNLPKEMENKKEGKDYFKIEKNGQAVYKVPKYIQGDTVRGSLHQDTFYGAIKVNSSDEIQYVVRKKLSTLSDDDLEKIIDQKVKEAVIAARKKEKELKKEIESLKKELRNADDIQEKELKYKITEIQNHIDNTLYVIPPKEGKSIYTPIRKVRIKAHLAEPLPEFKEHRDKKKNLDGTNKFPHKNWYYVQNDGNYCMVLYENKERTKRVAEIINNIDAGDYYKTSNETHKAQYPLFELSKKGLSVKGLLKIGTMVLFYKNLPDELWEMEQNDVKNRLYTLKKIGKSGQVQFQFHQEARNDEQIKEGYKIKFGTEPNVIHPSLYSIRNPFLTSSL